MNVEKRKLALAKIRKKYPDVNSEIGYIPKWVILAEAHPVLTKAVMSLAGTALGVLSALLILPR